MRDGIAGSISTFRTTDITSDVFRSERNVEDRFMISRAQCVLLAVFAMSCYCQIARAQNVRTNELPSLRSISHLRTQQETPQPPTSKQNSSQANDPILEPASRSQESVEAESKKKDEKKDEKKDGKK